MAETKVTKSPTEGSMAAAVDSAKAASTPQESKSVSSDASKPTNVTNVISTGEKTDEEILQAKKDAAAKSAADSGNKINTELTPSQQAEKAAQENLAQGEDAVVVTAINAQASKGMPSPAASPENPSILPDPQTMDNVVVTGIANTQSIAADSRVNNFYRKAQRKEVKLAAGKTHFYNAAGGRVVLPSAGEVVFKDNFYSTDDEDDIKELRKLEKATNRGIMEFKSEHHESFPEVTVE